MHLCRSFEASFNSSPSKKGLTLNHITSLYYIAPCSFAFLFVPWYLLEKGNMEVSQIQFNLWIFFSNSIFALALNLSIFIVIGRTIAVTICVAGVLKDWILIALSIVIFPESAITGLNIIRYAVELCGVVMYNYIKVKDVKASQNPPESVIILERMMSNDDDDDNIRSSKVIDEEAPLIAFPVPYDSYKEQMGSKSTDLDLEISINLDEKQKDLDYDFICFFLSTSRTDLYRSIDFW